MMKSFLNLLSSEYLNDIKLDGENDIGMDFLQHEIMFLLSSRPLITNISAFDPMLKRSILNYGIGEYFGIDSNLEERCAAVCFRVSEALICFEPRLHHSQVQIHAYTTTGCILIISGEHQNTEFSYFVHWDNVFFRFTLCDGNHLTC